SNRNLSPKVAAPSPAISSTIHRFQAGRRPDMLQFVLTRLLRALVTLFIIVTFTFIILRVAGDPATRFFDPAQTTPEVIAAFRRQWGLDQPLWVQFYKYLLAIIHGDLGNSMRENRSAIETVLAKLPATLQIMVPTLFIKTTLGIAA